MNGDLTPATIGGKLTADQVVEIRRRYQPRVYPMARLAREFGVCAQTICNIVNGRIWTR